MNAKLFPRVCLLVAAVVGPSWAQQAELSGGPQEPQPDIKRRFTEAQKRNAATLRQYTWRSRTELRLKGETKKVRVEQVRFDASGQQQKTLLEESPQGEPQARGGPLRRKIVQKKKEEFAELMRDMVKLVTSYAHIPAERMEAFVTKAQFSLGKGAHAGTIQISGQNAVQAGDTMKLWVDRQTMMMHRVEIQTPLEDKPVYVVLDFQDIPNGPTCQSAVTLDYPEKKIQVLIRNSDYRPRAPLPQAQDPASGSDRWRPRESVCWPLAAAIGP